jgi:3-oxoacyl-(acyl-carrier-protein) synthase
MRRVAITGIGILSAAGNGVTEYRASLQNCRSGIAWRDADQSWPADLARCAPRHLAAAVAEEPEDEACKELALAIDRHARYAIIAARQALNDARLPDASGAAVVVGTAIGGDHARDSASYRLFGKRQKPHPLTIVRTMLNGAASAVSIAFGLTGPALNISTACASSTHAIGEAFRLVQSGRVKAALAGGAESLPSYGLYRSWEQMNVLSRDGCRPFAADRNGIVLGEGAAMVALEPLETAIARGAHVYAEVSGFGMGADALDWVVPDGGGMLRCMRAALDDAGMSARELAYVNAHGTGTPRGDAAEAEALAELLGADAGRILVSSTKPLHGHALGATGAMETIASVIALEEGWAPPMPSAPRDPNIALRIVENEPAPLDGAVALTTSFAFGGLNAALVVRKAS